MGNPSRNKIVNTTSVKKTTFHREHYEWTDGQFSVSVDIPWSKADDIVILYRDTTTAEIVEQRLVATQ